LHAKAFQLAYDVAKKAETAWHHELGNSDRTFIQGGYLAGKEGLFAGDRLHFDLKQMELAYLEENSREYEITKQVSLAEWFPIQLIALRRGGRCEFTLPEQIYDLDCPGHSHRRIKSVALSLPCIAGPYTTINCSLTSSENYVRHGAGGYGKDPQDDTTNFTVNPATVSAIITSTAQADSGLFEPNLRDERYLPFEYAGAIGHWALELLGKPRPFDYDTIADAVLTIRYTARAHGNQAEAEKAAQTWLAANAARAFSMKHEFSSDWAAFKNTASGQKASLKFTLGERHFTYRLKEFKEPAKRLHLFLTGTAEGDIEFRRADEVLATTQATDDRAAFDLAPKGFDATGDYELSFNSNAFDNLWVVVDWSSDTS
jgi:hypothetical protein